MVIPASFPVIAVFNRDAGNGILWFFMLYVTGAYFSKYPPTRKVKTYVLTAIFTFIVAFLSQIIITELSVYLGLGNMGASRFSTFDSLPNIYGLEVSDTTVSRMTDKILPIAKELQQRPLEAICAVVFHYHVGSEGQIVKKAVYIASGIDLDGKKDVLGMYVGRRKRERKILGKCAEQPEKSRC